jgi:tRNA dimethylallyltransferase
MEGDLVVAIFGPTASGKTRVAEELTTRFPAELVSADSMQVYRGLPILTNQPSAPTKLVGIWELDHDGSVAEYQRLAHAEIDKALEARRTPVVVGGTGLYLRAAVSAFELPPPPEPGRREHWQLVYDRLGGERAHGLCERWS